MTLEEQIIHLKDLLQAKEKIIKKVDVEIKELKSEKIDLNEEIRSLKENNKRMRNGYEEQIQEINNNEGLYINTQWGNNIILAKQPTTVKTCTQWGNNITINPINIGFSLDYDKLADSLLEKIKKKSDEYFNYLNKYETKKVIL